MLAQLSVWSWMKGRIAAADVRLSDFTPTFTFRERFRLLIAYVLHKLY